MFELVSEYKRGRRPTSGYRLLSKRNKRRQKIPDTSGSYGFRENFHYG
jgi:hypothetical protein